MEKSRYLSLLALIFAVLIQQLQECNCECVGTSDAACKRTNTSPVCEGRGQCVCGVCECQSITSFNPSRRYSGRYCECNDYSCDFSYGQICGGPTRGRCVCGSCQCVPGSTGPACDCPASNSGCIAGDGSICNGKGKCVCGACVCSGNMFRGPTCEDCPTCSLQCDAYEPCVKCRAYENYKYISKENCGAQCAHVEVVRELDSNVDYDYWRRCRFRDDDGCDAYFEYDYSSNRVKAQAKKECPFGVSTTAGAAAISSSQLPFIFHNKWCSIGSIWQIGLLLLILPLCERVFV